MTVLACIDGSRYTMSVCDHAAQAALRLGEGVELLHALDRPPGIYDPIDRSGVMTTDMAEETIAEYARINETRRRLDQEQARRILDQAAQRVRAAGVTDVRERLVFGNLVDALRDHETDARLLVMGRRGAGAERAAGHLGTNLERTVRGSQRPVLIVPPDYRPLQRFVVAYDASPSSTRIIDLLTREPMLLDAECHLLMVGADDAKHRAQLAEAAERLRAAGYRVQETLQPGHADEIILATIEQTGADLLVMGAYGHSRIRTLIVGSTTTALLRAATGAVLIIR
jgi:nucleotide-binding universal stress UspA family protein